VAAAEITFAGNGPVNGIQMPGGIHMVTLPGLQRFHGIFRNLQHIVVQKLLDDLLHGLRVGGGVYFLLAIEVQQIQEYFLFVKKGLSNSLGPVIAQIA
jgi:hypothetical protein